MPPLTTSKGELVNGVFGFASIVLRGIVDLQPDYLAVSFDLPGPTFRHEQYADYKATRVKMPDDLRTSSRRSARSSRRCGSRSTRCRATRPTTSSARSRSSSTRNEDLETTIVTVDLDMLQLVTPRVRLMTTRSGVENTVIYDVDRIDERFGLRPDQMIDYKALKGDPTDNIPGVPGVGEKTAAKLIREFGDLDSLFARLDDVTPEKLRDKLREHREQIFMGRELSTIVRDLPIEIDLEAARLGDYDRDTVVRLFREYEFRRSSSGCRRWPARPPSNAPRPFGPSPRAATCRPPGRRSAGSGARAVPRIAAGGRLQLRLDFDAVTPQGRHWSNRRAPAVRADR